MTEKELLQLKEKIDNAKNESLKLEGQKEALLSQLKKEHNCDSLQAAKRKVTLLESEITKMEEEISEETEEVEKMLNENE